MNRTFLYVLVILCHIVAFSVAYYIVYSDYEPPVPTKEVQEWPNPELKYHWWDLDPEGGCT